MIDDTMEMSRMNTPLASLNEDLPSPLDSKQDNVEKRDTVMSSATTPYHTKKIEKVDIHEILREKGIFDSLGCQFHFSVFILQFVAHLFIPFMLLLPNPAAQGLRCAPRQIWYTVVQPLFVYAMIASFMMCTDNDRNLLGDSIIIPLLFFIVHRTTVALKYATMSPTEYARFMNCKDPEQIECYNSQLQLLSGWLSLNELVLYFELSAASSRIGVKINQIFLRISSDQQDSSAVSQFRYWNAFVRGHEQIDIDSKPAKEFVKLPNGDYGISVFDVCLAIIRRSNNYQSESYIVVAVTVLALALILIMVIPVVVHYDEVENPIAVAFYIVTATRIFWVYGRLFFGFLYVALIDVGRFCDMVKTLHCMIRLSDIMMHNSVTVAEEKVTSCHEGMSRDRVDTIISICKPPGSFDGRQVGFYDNERQEEESQYQAYPQEIDGRRNQSSGRFGEKLAKHLSFAMIPKVNLLYPENSTAWIFARLSIQNFGERFRNRTDIYLAFTMILVIIMMLVTLLAVVSASDRMGAYTSSLFLQAIIIVSLFIFMIILITIGGTSVNLELISQCRTLAAHVVRIKSKLFRYHEVDQKQYRHSKEELESALESVSQINKVADINNQLKPFKVFGMAAQNGLTMSVITAASSFYSIIFSMYSSSNTESLFSAALTAVRRG